MKTQLATIPEFMDLELLSRLPSLEIRARFLVQGFLSGMHRSPLRGFNVEFKEFRSYQAGDEPRTIDWKVYARTDRLQIKVREEDTNLTAYVIADASGSMGFRSDTAVMSKWDFARSLATALILLLHRQHDAASLSVLGPDLTFIRPSLKLSTHARMMAALDCSARAAGVPVSAGLEHLAQLVRPRSLIFVISDFYEDPQAMESAVRRLRHACCELIFLHVADPAELDFNYQEPVLLEELESRERRVISPDLMRKEYLQAFHAHRAALADIVRRHGGQYDLLRTDVPPYRAMGMYLAMRTGTL